MLLLQAKVLDELDDEFGVSALMEREFGSTRAVPSSSRAQAKPAAASSSTSSQHSGYSERDLAGLRVEHASHRFQPGESIILTLRDSSILDEMQLDDAERRGDEKSVARLLEGRKEGALPGDALINVDLADRERLERNLKNKKMRPDYQPVDDGEAAADAVLIFLVN